MWRCPGGVRAVGTSACVLLHWNTTNKGLSPTGGDLAFWVSTLDLPFSLKNPASGIAVSPLALDKS